MNETKQTKIIVGAGITLLVLGLAAFLTSGFFFASKPGTAISDIYQAVESADPLVTRIKGPEPLQQPIVLPTDFIRGNKNGPVTIAVFSDFSCPYCRTMATDLNRIINEFPSARLVWRDYPQPGLHPDALGAHIAAHCAGEQNKFWEYHDALFATEKKYERTTFLQIAQTLQLKPEQFASCLEGQYALPVIQRNLDEGDALAIDGTPYVFVNDQRLSGAVSYEELQQTIRLHTEIANTKK